MSARRSPANERVDTARRGLVNIALCAPAAALGAVLVPPAAAAPAVLPAADVAARTDLGYHETEHIRTYYALAARF